MSASIWAPAGAVLAAMAIAGLALAIWLLVRVRRMEASYASLLRGTDGGDLSRVLEQHMRELRAAMGQVREVDTSVRKLQADARCHVQHVGLVRYNPFRDTGGDQSFVLALADGDGNGTLITSLHMRDVTRVYAKPLQAWNSSHPLADEESRALRLAQDQKLQ